MKIFKMKENRFHIVLAATVLIALMLLLTGCGEAQDDPNAIAELDGKGYSLGVNKDLNQSMDDDSGAVESDLVIDGEEMAADWENSEETGKELSVKGVKRGDSLKDFIEALGVKKDYAEYDYENDLEGDGDTEINGGVFDGKVTDFQKEKVMDYVMNIYFGEKDGQWVLLNCNEDKPADYMRVAVLVDVNKKEPEASKIITINVRHIKTES